MDGKQLPSAIDVDQSELVAELRRLKRRALLFWPKEERTFLSWGLRDGMKVLEVGSGLGFATEQLLTLLPNSEITAIDADSAMVARSRKLLRGQGDGRLHLACGSSMATQLPDASFDFAIARFTFQYLEDPVGAVAEMRRVLRHGGKLAIVDADDAVWGAESPPRPELRSITEQVAIAQGHAGGNRHIGRQLVRVLRAGGLEALDFDTIAWHSDMLGRETNDVLADILDPDTFASLEEDGLITAEELTNIRRADSHWLNSGSPLMVCVAFVACGINSLA